MHPVLVQRKRTKGWRMPENTVSVCRPGKWGNPWHPSLGNARDASDAVAKYRAWAAGDPCHADILLALANQDERRSDSSECGP